jgi:hypothetical protein
VIFFECTKPFCGSFRSSFAPDLSLMLYFSIFVKLFQEIIGIYPEPLEVSKRGIKEP